MELIKGEKYIIKESVESRRHYHPITGQQVTYESNHSKDLCQVTCRREMWFVYKKDLLSLQPSTNEEATRLLKGRYN